MQYSGISVDVQEVNITNIKKIILFKIYSSSKPDLNSLVDFPNDLARLGKRFAPKSNNKIVKIINNSGSPNLINSLYLDK